MLSTLTLRRSAACDWVIVEISPVFAGRWTPSVANRAATMPRSLLLGGRVHVSTRSCARTPTILFGEKVPHFQTSHPRKGLAMLPFPTAFEDRLFRYIQVAREGDMAIFTQTHKPSGCVRYEVVLIRVQPAHTWPTGITTPEKEAYPSSTSWGRLGHTCFTLPEARALAATWRQQRA